MEGDSELNICLEDKDNVTQPLRKKLWNIHTGGAIKDDRLDKVFTTWGNIIVKNGDLEAGGTDRPVASLVGFQRASPNRTYED